MPARASARRPDPRAMASEEARRTNQSIAIAANAVHRLGYGEPRLNLLTGRLRILGPKNSNPTERSTPAQAASVLHRKLSDALPAGTLKTHVRITTSDNHVVLTPGWNNWAGRALTAKLHAALNTHE